MQTIKSMEKLNKILSTPSSDLINKIKEIKGNIMVLGAGGKMGPSLCLLAKKAIQEAEVNKKIIAVSRFSDKTTQELLEGKGIETIAADLLNWREVKNLPEVQNIIYMVGRKFGTSDQQHLTWAVNVKIPSLIANKFKDSKIVVFSSGNIYPMVSLHSGGVTEKKSPEPLGEYAMSVLGRERMFEYASQEWGTEVLMFRLNYAVDLRYGVLHDIAVNIINDKPVIVDTPSFNCIWQGDANEMAIKSLMYTSSSAEIMNITGPETVSVKYVARKMGQLLNKKPEFIGEEADKAYLSNSSRAMETFGYPSVSLNTLIKWQVHWLKEGGPTLDKPTHFQERKGEF